MHRGAQVAVHDVAKDLSVDGVQHIPVILVQVEVGLHSILNSREVLLRHSKAVPQKDLLAGVVDHLPLSVEEK